MNALARTAQGIAAGLFVYAIAGCSSSPLATADTVPATSNVVPPPAGATPIASPVTGENTVWRHGSPELSPSQGQAPAPVVINLLPQQAFFQMPPGGTQGDAQRYVPWPPPPPAYAEPRQPHPETYNRAVAGALIGGVAGYQFGSGSGRVVGAGIGAATGAMLGAVSGDPCLSPHGGTFLGGLAGGALGYQIGSGSGQAAATAIGAGLGALAGTRAYNPNCR